MLNNSVSNKSFIIKTLLYGSAIAAIVVALLLSSFMPTNVVYADTEESYINFNQLFNNTISRTNYYTISISKSDTVYSVNGYFTNWNAFIGVNENTPTINIISGHIYYINFNFINNDGVNIYLGVANNWSDYVYKSTNYNNPSAIFTANQNNTCAVGLFLSLDSGTSSSNQYNFTIQPILIDLTQCFGAAAAENLTVEQVNNIFPSPYYNYTTGLILSQNSIDQYSVGYNNGVRDTLASFVIENTVSDSYNLITTVDYNNQPTSTSREILDIDGQQHYAVVCIGLAKLPFTVRANTTLKLNIEQFSLWTSDPDNTIYYNIYYLYNGELINLYSKSGNRQTYISGEFEFYIPVDIDGIIFECSEQYILINISAQYQTYNLQTAINKALESGQQNGYDLGFKDGKATGYDLGLRSNDNLVNGGFWTFFSGMITNISSIFNVELFGGITIGTLILIPLLFTVLILVLKLVRGSG